MKSAVRNRFGAGLLAFAMVMAQIIMPVSSAFATNEQAEVHGPDPKVFVCKYVGKPGVDERLKEGKNPISVSSNATVDTYFNDAQGRSYVLAIDNTNPGPEDDPDVSECPDGDSADGQIITPSVVASVICGPENDRFTVPASPSYVIVDNLDGTYTLTANTGYIFTTSLTNTVVIEAPADEDTSCPVVDPCTVSIGSTIVTEKSQFADFAYQDTRSKGHAEFQSDGLRIYTDDNSSEAKVAWYKDVIDYSLAQVGEPTIEYTSTVGIKPGMQIVLDKDGDGISDGIIVGEPDAYGNNWWSKSDYGVGSGMGYTSYGTLNEYLAANPNAKVMAIGFSLGSGVLADGLLKSVTFGCYTWSFEKAPRVPTQCTVSDNLFIKDWQYDGDTYPQADLEGTYDFQQTGLYINTPTADSYVYGLMDAGNTPILDVDAMSYKAMRLAKSGGYSSTLPAYILYVDTNGLSVAGGGEYFFYEPYYNDNSRAAVEGSFQSWDTLAGGNAKWYVSGTGQALRSWSSLATEFEDAVIVAYGFNQGQSNPETYSAVQDIEFDCATTIFGVPGSGGSGEEPEVPVVPVVPTAPSVPVTPSTPVGGQGALLPAELPMTGENGSIVFTWIALLAAILTYGAVYYLQPKKRFEQ